MLLLGSNHFLNDDDDGCMNNIAIKLVIFNYYFFIIAYVLSIVLLLNPHHTKARYRLAESLDGQGKIAEAFTQVTRLQRIYPEVNGLVADRGDDRPFYRCAWPWYESEVVVDLALIATSQLFLRTVPTIVTAHTFCASPDTRISYRQCLLIHGYFCAV